MSFSDNRKEQENRMKEISYKYNVNSNKLYKGFLKLYTELKGMSAIEVLEVLDEQMSQDLMFVDKCIKAFR